MGGIIGSALSATVSTDAPADTSVFLSFCKIWSTVETLNLGGGYKVGRVEGEVTTDLQKIGEPVADAFRQFAEENDGRELKLEIEPGTYLVAMSGGLVSTIQ